MNNNIQVKEMTKKSIATKSLHMFQIIIFSCLIMVSLRGKVIQRMHKVYLDEVTCKHWNMEIYIHFLNYRKFRTFPFTILWFRSQKILDQCQRFVDQNSMCPRNPFRYCSLMCWIFRMHFESFFNLVSVLLTFLLN